MRTPGNPEANRTSPEAKEPTRLQLLYNGEEAEVQVPLRQRGFGKHLGLLVETPEGPQSRSKGHAQ